LNLKYQMNHLNHLFLKNLMYPPLLVLLSLLVLLLLLEPLGIL
jgi:hypothetical protein